MDKSAFPEAEVGASVRYWNTSLLKTYASKSGAMPDNHGKVVLMPGFTEYVVAA